MSKVFVGMSGGVDSSVSAALLKEQGYSVTGVFIRVWSPDFLPCDWKKEREDAMRVAAELDIPFKTFDFQDEYKKEVVDYMISEYKAGRTPNPDVMCNKHIKFGSFLKKALKEGADFVATGHYAQKREVSSSKNQVSRYELLKGKDNEKDQSYFLYTLNQEQLSKILFPIGHLEKSEVRELAKKFNLPNAEKKDSQGICFLGKIDTKEFLKHYIETKKGSVLNENSEVIGEHPGAMFFTMGERRGFTITKKTPDDKPYYVVGKNVEENTITVSNEVLGEFQSNKKEVELEKVNWISEIPEEGKTYEARLRYRQNLRECSVDGSKAVFKEMQENVTSGQSLVIYDEDVCMGGGVIK